MSEKEKTINIEFKLDNLKDDIEGNTKDKQPEATHYRKIQETKEGQDLIQDLAKVINNIGNIDIFITVLRSYIKKYAKFKEKHSSINFKIRDIKFKYNDREDATLNEIITATFNGNNELIQLYGRIIDQFDRVCENLDKVFNIKYNSNSFEHFMNDLSLKTISPLTIELCANIINIQIKKISDELNKQCKKQEDTDKLNACKNKFINLQNGTQLVRKELKTGLSHEKEGSTFKRYDSEFKKDDNYLPLVKDEYNRNYLHYAWRHFEGVSAQNGSLEKIKARLLEYADNNKENIKQACNEQDAYGLTPLCYVLIEAFDSGINNEAFKERLDYVLKYFDELGVSTQLHQEELQAIYDYFQITKNARGQEKNMMILLKQ